MARVLQIGLRESSSNLGETMTTKDAFKTRRRALEDAFFRNVDQALIELMREQSVSGKARKKLSESTGITNEAILDELLGAGVTHATIVALLLLPLAEVAWADGKVDDEEKAIVISTANSLGYKEESTGMKLLACWLDEKPSLRLFGIWRGYASELCEHLTQTTRSRLADLIVERSKAVAKATGGFLGVHKTSAKETEVIQRIEAALSV